MIVTILATSLVKLYVFILNIVKIAKLIFKFIIVITQTKKEPVTQRTNKLVGANHQENWKKGIPPLHALGIII